MAGVYLGFGSNIDDRLMYLGKALNEISKLRDTKIIKCSSVYQTEPWGIKEQNAFLNFVLFIETEIYPSELLKELKDIEIRCGRIKRNKWYEREIDIDILFYGNVIFDSEQLVIPHPEMQNRKFVLVPLNEINSGFIHPVFNVSVESLLERTSDKSEVKLYKDKI
jgi:2-amino-4-hydroxy-6-hydroxymethyldihydropteridine diphosphokinase